MTAKKKKEEVVEEFEGLFGETETLMEDFEKTSPTTLLENISILTYLKAFSVIEKNGGVFYGIYKKSNKGYESLEKIQFDRSVCPSETDSIKVRAKVLDYGYLPSLVNYMSYDQELMKYMIRVKDAVGFDADKKSVFRLLESILPKRRFYIRNLGKKSKTVENKIIERISLVMNVSKERAMEYIDITDSSGTSEEFMDCFRGDSGKRLEMHKRRGKK